ncbi:dTDP-4-dehydrorhamnose 3,5-epimerase family protein [Pseudoxanthomonas sp. CAU 1598]|uniref:dTDP-4-dehydrorhamnose 3,5-epimerase n=1 Tax=Pseudomarimonas arenosa TaxID=2774145 RepID=A0AAW3ZFR6_9GAMM|nr:dTDP-4-dehydrorhamnose 3,5-epimerase family protein [Pseudomarimonas arenosa]
MAPLPRGVQLQSLGSVSDSADSIALGRSRFEFAQFNLVCSRPGTLRGMHVHACREDSFTVLSGALLIALADVRDGPGFERVSLFELAASTPQTLIIPAGVLHGFYSPGPSKVLYGLSKEWDPRDELGCIWNDPSLSIPWPCAAPTLSVRDAALGSYEQLVGEWRCRIAELTEDAP